MDHNEHFFTKHFSKGRHFENFRSVLEDCIEVKMAIFYPILPYFPIFPYMAIFAIMGEAILIPKNMGEAGALNNPCHIDKP